MKNRLKTADEIVRRDFMRMTAQVSLGVGILSQSVADEVFSASNRSPSFSKRPSARNVIYLYMSGGMSHLDTFDPKPGTEQGGPVKSIRTSVDDVFLSEYLPGLAQHMDKAAVIRSLSSTQGAHEQGNYFMHTSYQPRGTIRHPGLGAWIQKLDGKINRTLPAAVTIGGGRNSSAGFMESKFSPLQLSNPNEGLRNSNRKEGLSEREFQDRLALANSFNEEFRSRFPHKDVRAQKDVYDDAVRLMNSEDLKAFQLGQEDAKMREAYGNNGFGQGVLLARRLIENDVRFVEVDLGGWDTHSNNFLSVAARAAILDQALSTLLKDLEMRGMLSETMVVVATEFGRTPMINQNDGRDHFPKAFSGLIAGGTVRGGVVYGKTDEGGAEVVEGQMGVPDFNATIAYGLGLPLDKVITSPSGRPFTIAHRGKPVTELFA